MGAAFAAATFVAFMGAAFAAAVWADRFAGATSVLFAGVCVALAGVAFIAFAETCVAFAGAAFADAFACVRVAFACFVGEASAGAAFVVCFGGAAFITCFAGAGVDFAGVAGATFADFLAGACSVALAGAGVAFAGAASGVRFAGACFAGAACLAPAFAGAAVFVLAVLFAFAIPQRYQPAGAASTGRSHFIKNPRAPRATGRSAARSLPPRSNSRTYKYRPRRCYDCRCSARRGTPSR